jgi:phytoene synthase
LARLLHAPDAPDAVLHAARRWALADLASGLGNASERAGVVKVADREPAKRPRLSRTLRPLTVLDGLAHKSLARGGAQLLAGTSSLLLAMRLGLAGRYAMLRGGRDR